MSWILFSATDFEQHSRQWDRINLESSGTPLLDSRFILPLLKTFARGDEILALYGDSAMPTAMAILVQIKPCVWSTFQPSQAPIGSWVQKQMVSIRHLADELLHTLPGFPLLLSITQQDPDLFSRPQENKKLGTIDYIRTARITTNCTFDKYWSSRGKNLRHNLNRQRNRLSKNGIKTRLETVTNLEDVWKNIVDYGRLESAGWKKAHGTAIHPENMQGKFYYEMLRAFSAFGRARIYRYYYNDQIKAMDLCVIGNGCLVILKTTYDETEKTTSPAILMRQDAFESIFSEPAIKQIEFYGRVMDWHTKWSDEIRVMYHVNYYRWSLLELLHRYRQPDNS